LNVLKEELMPCLLNSEQLHLFAFGFQGGGNCFAGFDVHPVVGASCREKKE
jgi:hypothetical protein